MDTVTQTMETLQGDFLNDEAHAEDKVYPQEINLMGTTKKLVKLSSIVEQMDNINTCLNTNELNGLDDADLSVRLDYIEGSRESSFGLKGLDKCSATSLRQLSDKLNAHMRALETM
ncbi:hypothetical protein EVAR_91339_1 [Eumeta japonica]|uniref:Uncharacterized protein n=1 Tax=Eumeta variegata TaxID=151549 RepID=A0A4C1TRA6_EUMVA|nr:hypothetical protein EVAR_91339_1 [Eumeta japonica]